MMRLHRSILSAALLASLCCLSHSAQSKFTVGTATAAHGEKSSGTLEVPAGVDAATSIPVVIVNGAKPGKVLALVSGAHGTEYVSIFALDHIRSSRARPTDPAPTRYLDNTPSGRAKPSIVVEAGHAGTVESDDVALLVNGTLSTMRALKMLPGDPHTIENPVWIEKLVDVLAEGPGIWYPLVKRGAYVSAGMKLGTITDYVGKVIAEPRAPVSGIVLHVNAVPSLKKGDNIADLGVPASHAP